MVMSDDIRQLVRVLHGSHLYGTNTTSSDMDIKGVHIPSARAIIMQRAENVIDRRDKISDTIKNQAGDTDEQSYSVQKFLGMIAAGDTNAAEILFAPSDAILSYDPLWEEVQAAGRAALNRQCKGFVGYCRRQAAKYGIKGSRMAAVKRLMEIMEPALLKHGTTAKLAVISSELEKFAQDEEHADWVDIPHPGGATCWHIECCDRKMPTTSTIKEAAAVYAKVWENYGARARAAMTNEGIDWKAVSHAVRVARQAIELLQTGHITFPRPDAAELLDIKLGRRDYSEISQLLEKLVEQVERESFISALPEKSDHKKIDETVMRLYLSQIERR